jgi:hypothetical protein
MKVTKEEFNNYRDLYGQKYNIEVKIILPFSEFLECLTNNADNPIIKHIFESKLIDPKHAISFGVIEKLTGLSKEKITYIEKNFTELFHRYKK